METVTATVGGSLEWAGLLALILALLALDLGLFQRREPSPGLAAALAWSGAWTAAALLFYLWTLLHFGRRIGFEFLAGYLVERSLSFDNLLVFLLLLDGFAVPQELRRRVLSWGIFGALAGRGLFIALGTVLLRRWEWVLQLLGLFLMWTGARAVRHRDAGFEPPRVAVAGIFRRFVPLTSGYRGGRFLVHEEGRLLATPLLLVLVVIEAADLAFAIDSVPAVFGVTRHPFIVFSSNAFAILGLRALFPVVEELVRRFHRLRLGLGLVLVVIGVKMVLDRWLAIPVELVLAAVLLILGLAVAASLLLPPPRRPPAPDSASADAD
jgi:tellurite resistance protein TerC